MIGSYYYAWYKKDWLHRTVRAKDPPSLAEYDNTIYGSLLSHQMEDVKRGGIDFLSISYNGEDLGHMLDAANKAGIKATYFFESLRYANSNWKIDLESLPKLLKEIDNIKQDMNEECW